MAALVAWGPVVPAPASPPTDGATQSAAGSAQPRDVAAAAPDTVELQAPAPAPPPSAAPAPAATTPVAAPVIAKAPLNVQATPTLVATPERPRTAGGDLHKQWWFWTIAGGCFALVIVATIIATRPGPAPYTGNAPPYYVPFP